MSVLSPADTARNVARALQRAFGITWRDLKEDCMALYTFHRCAADGTSETCVAFELQDDYAADDVARQLLDQHASAEFIVAWCGRRRVVARARLPIRWQKHSNAPAIEARPRGSSSRGEAPPW
ncbi:hypothetical protein [uncultured Phenylobacterium sp.]|uniref:hypothetical protein n=1 Tax=uncultured Phenylobacterium sp. TaxID=349273 RepID=UPI0025CD50D0|nr:hypothetical protein [uncultured Phenylobacterium sp.]